MMDGKLYRRCQEAAATPGKTVVVVEGAGDIAFLTQMLDKPPFRERNLFTRFVLMEAGGKDAALTILEAFPDFRAMVDRDAWPEAVCEKRQRDTPGLHILPRFCIENYLICPGELAAALPGFEEADAIQAEIPNAIRHGCLWRAAQPLYEQLMGLGFNKALLTFPPPDEKRMEELVSSWQALLSAESIRQAMDEALAGVAQREPLDLLRTFCHGKIFFKSVVAPRLKERFPGENTEGLKRKLYRRLPLPEDLQTFLEEVFLQ